MVNVLRRADLAIGSIAEVTNSRTGPFGGHLNGRDDVVALQTPTGTVPIAATWSSPMKRELVQRTVTGRLGAG